MIGLNIIRLEVIGLNWIRNDRVRYDQVRNDRVKSVRVRYDRVRNDSRLEMIGLEMNYNYPSLYIATLQLSHHSRSQRYNYHITVNYNTTTISSQ